MRGHPLIRLFILCVCLLGTAWWILRLAPTEKSGKNEVPRLEKSALVEVEYRIRTTALPEQMTLSLGDQVVFSWKEGDPSEGSFRVKIPGEGMDGILDAHWSDKEWHAMEIALRAASYGPFIQTFWGREALKDVVSLRPR